MRLHKVLFGGGDQTLSTIPHDDRGRPLRITTATYRIEDLRHGEASAARLVASGSVTHDNISDALSAAAGPGQANPKEIAVADVAAYAIGSTYMIDGLEGNELFELDEIDATSNRLYARHPLTSAYAATTSSVLSVELKCTFPEAEAAREASLDDQGGPYLVVWRYTSSGQTYVVSEQAFVQRYDERPMITESEVWLAFPGLKGRGQKLVADAIKVATDDFLAAVESAGKDPAYFRSSPRAAVVAIRSRAIEYLLRWQQTEGDNENADRFEDRYKAATNDILNGIPPRKTIEIDPAAATSPPGSSKMQGLGLFRRS